jgi:formyl-CoA transferase
VNRVDWQADRRFATNPDRVRHRDQLVPQLVALFATQPTDHWLRMLEQSEVPHAPVLPLDEVLAGEQAIAREMVSEVCDRGGRRYRLLGSPVHWAGETRPAPIAPPGLGEHSEAVLRDWLDLPVTEVAELRLAKTIQQAVS